jgi:hypothetical protein
MNLGHRPVFLTGALAKPGAYHTTTLKYFSKERKWEGRKGGRREGERDRGREEGKRLR